MYTNDNFEFKIFKMLLINKKKTNKYLRISLIFKTGHNRNKYYFYVVKPQSKVNVKFSLLYILTEDYKKSFY